MDDHKIVTGTERKAAAQTGTGTWVEARGRSQDSNGDGKESSSGDGNGNGDGDRDGDENENGNEDEIRDSGGKAIKRKKPHNKSFRRDVGSWGNLGGKRKNVGRKGFKKI